MNITDIKEAVFLHYLPAVKRVKIMEESMLILKTLGINKIEQQIAIPLPHFDKITNFHRLNIANSNLININDVYYDKVNVFNCSLNWYIALKKLENESGYFLFMEDDTVLNDIEEFKNIIENTPSDCNILRISYDNIDYQYVKNYNEFLYKQMVQNTYNNWRGGSTACFILDQKGIKHCCNFIERNGYLPADHMLMNITDNLNTYIAKKCPVVNKSLIDEKHIFSYMKKT